MTRALYWDAKLPSMVAHAVAVVSAEDVTWEKISLEREDNK
jgi:hypothetical protein